MLLIITSTGDRLFKFINIDDLEPTAMEDLAQTLTTTLAIGISKSFMPRQ